MSDHSPNHAALLALRYGGQETPDNILWTPQVEAMVSHRSVRAFLPEPLPEGALETMVAAAQSASTSSALNQWSVVAVTDAELKQQLADTVARRVPTDRIPWIEEAPALLLWIADASRAAEMTRGQGAEPVVLDYLDSFLKASVDVALAAQNAALAAESLGLGVVFLGVVRNAGDEIAQIIQLPAYSFVAFGMAVGRPDLARVSGIRPRPAQGMVLHRDRYDQIRSLRHVEGYEQASLAFRQAQGMRVKSWSSATYEAMTNMDDMGERQTLRETVMRRGFKLR